MCRLCAPGEFIKQREKQKFADSENCRASLARFKVSLSVPWKNSSSGDRPSLSPYSCTEGHPSQSTRYSAVSCNGNLPTQFPCPSEGFCSAHPQPQSPRPCTVGHPSQSPHREQALATEASLQPAEMRLTQTVGRGLRNTVHHVAA